MGYFLFLYFPSSYANFFWHLTSCRMNIIQRFNIVIDMVVVFKTHLANLDLSLVHLMPSLTRNWLLEHLTFKIQHLVRCQSTLANLEKTKKENHGKFGRYLCKMSNGIS
jgi:hypothetical protein